MIFKNCFFPPPLRYFPKSKKAAALLLYNLWSDKDLQSFLKKVSRSLTPSAKIWVCPLCFLPFTPLSGICEKQMEKDWRIWQCRKCPVNASETESSNSGLKKTCGANRVSTCRIVMLLCGYAHIYRALSRNYPERRGSWVQGVVSVSLTEISVSLPRWNTDLYFTLCPAARDE